MTDDIARLKDALAKEPPVQPREAAKKRAIELAMTAYDEKKRAGLQGNAIGRRLMGTATAVYETLAGRRPMKLSPAFAGGASLSVLLVAALGATHILTSNPKFTPLPVPAPAPKPPQMADQKTHDAMLKRLADKRLALEKKFQEGRKTTDGTRRLKATRNPEAERLAKVPHPKGSADATSQRRITSGPTAGAVPGAPYGGSADLAPREVMPVPGYAGRPIYEPQVQVGQDNPGRTIFEDQGRDRFEAKEQNPVKVAREEPVSTFSIDVDTASYSIVRSWLNDNVLPPKDAVRVEEMINYFPYDYAKPDDRSVPFKANVSVFPSPWNAGRKLMHIGIAGFEAKQAEKPHSNLVFLLDTSGSMNAPNKLPLMINSMKLLLETLLPDDTVAIVTYAGNAGTALEPTPVGEKAKILAVLNGLSARGSTAGAEGIRQAYELARSSFHKDGVNRVILATDGDFNVGITDRNELKSFIERQRESGIYLSVLGFGRGNYNDTLMQAMAQNGNGNAAYIDTLGEARKVLVEEASSTLFPIAKDVKIQVEFNPLKVAEYRLIGYETRMLKREDFNNDKVDAGDIGAGHTVTAIYEIAPVESASRSVDPLRYGTAPAQPGAGQSDEYAFLKIRYKLPHETASKLITTPIDAGMEAASVEAAPREARFSTAVAAFAQILKGGTYAGSYGYDDVIALAQGAKGEDAFGYRAEFINLVRLAKSAPALEPMQKR